MDLMKYLSVKPNSLSGVEYGNSLAWTARKDFLPDLVITAPPVFHKFFLYLETALAFKFSFVKEHPQ